MTGAVYGAAPQVLVIGGSGPIGLAISGAAATHSTPVISVSRSSRRRLDVADPDSLRSVMREVSPSAIIYLVRGDPSKAEARSTEDLRHVVEIAALAGTERFVLASSAAVYGDRHSEPRRESDPLEGTSEYAREKIRAEAVMTEVGEAHGMSTASLRVFNVFGPGCRGSLINALIDGPPPRLALTSRFVRDYVHVSDVARAFLRAVGDVTATGPMNIGSGRGIANTDLAAVSPGAYLPGYDAVSSYSLADPTRAGALLGWAATVDAVECIRAARVRG
ncbi:NAD-dependent epimerase/dehydratase family protein [Microbacterium aurum]